MAKKQIKKPLRIALVQLTSTNDLQENIKLIKHALFELKGKSCDLVCLPENALFLRINEKPSEIPSFNLREKFWADLQESIDTENLYVFVGSIAYKKNKSVTNATVLLSPKKKPKVVYEKIHLFDVDVKGEPAHRESAVFKAGKKPAAVQIHGWKIGLSICYDMRFAELYTYYADHGADLILVPSAFLVPTGQAHWHTLLKARAIESQCYVAAAAQCGGHRGRDGMERKTFGHSLIIDPWGSVLLDMGNESRGVRVAYVDLDPDKIDEVRRQIPMAHHRRL